MRNSKFMAWARRQYDKAPALSWTTITSGSAPAMRQRHSLDYMELEDRTLFNAAPIAAPAAGNTSSLANQVAAAAASPQVHTSSTTSVSNVVLIDTSLANWNVLAQATVPGDKVFLFDGASQSASQVLGQVVTWAEDAHTLIASIALLDHGVGGAFELGNQWISAVTLPQTAAEWQQLGSVLTSGAEIELFGCDVAAPGSQGQTLLDQLAQLTGAEVFASTNATGQGGDWNLEAASAGAQPQLAAGLAPTLNAQVLDTYSGTLGTIAVDNTTTAGSHGNVSSLTWSHTVGSGSDGILVVDVSVANGTSVSSVTYGGVALTKIGAVSNGSSVEMWYLKAPTAGTANIVVTLSASAEVVAGATDYFGVDQAKPLGTFTAATDNSNSASVTVASTTGSLVIDSIAFASDMVPISPSGTGQTQLWNANSGVGANFDAYGAGSWQSGAPFVTMSWSSATADNWELGAVALNAVVVPAINAPASASTNENTNIVFSSGNGNQISVTDSDATSGTVQLSLSAADGTLTLGGTTGLTFTSGGNGTGALTVQGTLANINSAISTLTYAPASNYNGSDSLTLGYSDPASTQTANATVALTVNQVDQPPTNTVPGTQTVNDNATLVFSSGNGNQISVADSDSGGNPEQVALSVGSGTLTLSGTTGLTFTAGSNGSGSMTVQGTLANLNAALNGLTYTPPTNLTNNGSTTLNLVTNDLGNTGSGGPLTASSSVNITLDHVDHAPTNTVPGAQTLNDNTTLVFSSGNGNQLSVADSDSNGSSEQVALSVGSGTLTLSGTTGLTITAGSNGSASMTVQGTLANLNAALNGLTYTPPSNLTGNSSDTLNLVTNDLGNTGSGGPLTASSSVNITLDHVDRAPVNTVPGAQTVNDNATLVFSSGNGNQISVADSDANGSSEQVALSVGSGTLTLSGTTGLTFTAGSNGSGLMTLQGTLANLNAALNGLIYTPPANLTNNSSATLNVVTNDLGNSGSGGPLTASSSVTITLDHVDHPPVNTVPGSQTINDNTTLVFSSGNGNQISVADSDSNGSSEQVALSVGSGTLTLSGTTGLTFTAGSNGSASMTLQGTLANLNAALNGLTYTPPSGLTGNSSDTLNLVSNDLGNTGSGGPLTASSAVNITLDHVDRAPTNTVPGTQTVNDNATLVFSSGNGNQISVADSDANGSAEQVALSVGSGTLTLSGTTGLTFAAGSNGSASMTVQGTLANLNAALNGLTYTPPSNLTNNSSDTLNLVTNDLGNSGSGGPLTASSSVNITVDHVDHAPVNTVPGAQTVNDNTTLVFSSGNGNQISIADSDSNGSAEQVALSVGSGTLTLSGTTGLTFTAGSNGSAAMTVQGTLANLNAALNGLTYTPPANLISNSSDTLNLVTNDLGNTGSGGPLTASSSVNITLDHVDHAPVNTVPGTQTVNDNTTLVFSSGNGNQIAVADSDSNGNAEQVALSVGSGTLTLSGTTGLTFTAGSNGSASMTVQGTLANLNAALNGLAYAPPSNLTNNSSDTLNLVTNDLGNTGSGGPLTTSSSVSLTVNHVDLAPANTVPGSQALNDNSTLVFSSGNGNQISVADSDANGSAEQVAVSVGSGTLTLSGTTGLTFTAGSNGSATMTVQGTLANLNAALNGLTYTPPANLTNNSSDTLNLVTSDLGNTGVGGPLTASSSVNITLDHVDRAPTNTVPGAQTVNDNTTLVFSSGNGNQIAVADTDSNGSAEQVALSVGSGTLTLSGTTGLTFTTGSNGSATMTVQGTLADLNAALNGLTYTPPSNLTNNSSDTLNLVTNDLGNTGSGGPLTASSAVSITLNHVDLAPTNTVPGSQTLNDNSTLVFSSGNGNQIAVADSDANGSAEQVALSVGSGTLTLSGTTGLTFTAGGNGSATMTVQGTLANLNAALNGLTYTPPSNLTGNSSDTLNLVTSDLGNTGSGGPLTASSSVNITLDHVDRTPTNTVPGTQTVDDNATLVFSSGNGNQISVADSDANGNAEQVALSVGSGTLTLSGTTGLTFTAGSNGSATMTVQGTLANLNAALNGLTYTPQSNLLNNSSDTLNLVTNDLGNSGSGGPQQATSAVALTINHVDLAPVNTLPGTQSTYENATVVFSNASGNQISIADADANGRAEQVTMAATSGVLTLNGTAGLTFTTGTGSANATMTFTGTIANINNALNGLTFSPGANFVGTATVLVTTSDLGNSGVGGPKTATGSVDVSVAASQPTLSVPSSQMTSGYGLTFSTLNGNPIIVGVASGVGTVQVTLAATGGTVALAQTAGLTFSAGNGGTSTNMVFTGSIAAANAALDGLHFQTDGLTNSLQIVVANADIHGAGAPPNATATVTITQVPLIPPPYNPPATISPNSSSAGQSDASTSQSAASTASATQTVVPKIQQRAEATAMLAPPAARPPLIAAQAVTLTLPGSSKRIAAGQSELPQTMQPGQSDSDLRKPSPTRQSGAFNPQTLWDQIHVLAESSGPRTDGAVFTIETLAGVGTALSAGYVIWLVRTGTLVASILSSMPAWKSFDPLPVLEFWERNPEKKRPGEELCEVNPDETDLQAILNEPQDPSTHNSRAEV